MTYDNNWASCCSRTSTRPRASRQYVQKNFEDSRPQWQKYIGMFDADWAKLYFS